MGVTAVVLLAGAPGIVLLTFAERAPETNPSKGWAAPPKANLKVISMLVALLGVTTVLLENVAPLLVCWMRMLPPGGGVGAVSFPSSSIPPNAFWNVILMEPSRFAVTR